MDDCFILSYSELSCRVNMISIHIHRFPVQCVSCARNFPSQSKDVWFYLNTPLAFGLGIYLVGVNLQVLHYCYLWHLIV